MSIMEKKKSAPTIKDVAREAGVAIGTVSKVINHCPVGEEYRLRVEAAIEKLGYRVNYYARGMKSNQTRTIAVLIPNLVSPYFCSLTSEINRAASQRGYQTMVFCTDYDANIEQECLLLAEQKRADGMICLSYNPNIQVPGDPPFVSIDRYFGGNITCVASDNFGGGVLAAEKLHACGCRRVAFMRIGSILTNEPNKRKNGFLETCERLGMEVSVKVLDDGAPYSEFEDFLREAYSEGGFRPEGIFCVTDSLAYHTMGMLKKLGLRVPEEVQIIGFDGVRHFGDLDYYCSTIVQPVPLIAETAVKAVLGEMGDAMPTLMCLPVKYAFGGTTRE